MCRSKNNRADAVRLRAWCSVYPLQRVCTTDESSSSANFCLYFISMESFCFRVQCVVCGYWVGPFYHQSLFCSFSILLVEVPLFFDSLYGIAIVENGPMRNSACNCTLGGKGHDLLYG